MRGPAVAVRSLAHSSCTPKESSGGHCHLRCTGGAARCQAVASDPVRPIYVLQVA